MNDRARARARERERERERESFNSPTRSGAMPVKTEQREVWNEICFQGKVQSDNCRGVLVIPLNCTSHLRGADMNYET